MSELKNDKKAKNISNPDYYGEIQPWAKVMKGLFSLISMVVFMFALLGSKHDVRAFYTSLLLSSSTVFVDLLVIYFSIKDKEEISLKSIKKILNACRISGLCFAGSISILLLSGKDITLIDSYLSGTNWGITLIIFPFIVYAFLINIYRPISHDRHRIKREPRPYD